MMKQTISWKDKIFNSRFLSFVVIALVTLAVFFPSLSHISRSDQEHFFIETSDYHGFWSNLAHTYSYSRQRVINAGDIFLFKPAYFVVLAFEKAAFGYHYWMWQLFSVVFHIGVVWQLYCLLLELGLRRRMIFFISLFFSLIFVSQDMVTFQHMNVCLVLNLLLIKTLRYIFAFMRRQQSDIKLFWKIFGMILILCFMRESGLIYGASIIVGLVWHRWFYMNGVHSFLRSQNDLWQGISKIGLLLIPFAIYFLWDGVDYLARVGFKMPFSQTGSPVPNLLGLGWWFFLMLVGPLVPIFLNIHLGPIAQERIILENVHFINVLKGPSEPFFWLGVVNYIVLAGVVIVGMNVFYRLIKQAFQKKVTSQTMAEKDSEADSSARVSLGWVSLLSMAGYTYILFSMRFAERGLANLFYNLYYFYPMIILAVIIFSIIFRRYLNNKGWMSWLVCALLFIAAGLNGYKNVVLNFELKDYAKQAIKDKQEQGFQSYYLGKKYNALGVYAMRGGKIQLAQNYFDQGRKANPKNQDVYYNSGILYSQQNNFAAAIEWASQALQLNSLSVQSLILRGYAFYALNRHNEAMTDLNKVIQLEATNASAYFYRGLVFIQTQQYALAAKDMLKAQSLGVKEATQYIQFLNSQRKQ